MGADGKKKKTGQSWWVFRTLSRFPVFVQTRYCFGGSGWTGDLAKKYRDHSPITDARVPITQSDKLYHALKDNNVHVKFIAYPTSGHFPGDPVRQKDLFGRWNAWLEEHLRQVKAARGDAGCEPAAQGGTVDGNHLDPLTGCTD